MRFVSLVLPLLLLATSCARNNDATLTEKKYTREELLKLKKLVYAEKDLKETLEVGFALVDLDKDTNVNFEATVRRKVGDHVRKNLGTRNMPEWVSSYAAPVGVFLMLYVFDASSTPAGGGGLKGVSMRKFSSFVGVGSLIGSSIFAKNAYGEQYTLTEEQLGVISSALKESEFSKHFATLLSFLELSKEDGRALERNFRKAVVAVYDRTKEQATKEVLTRDILFQAIDKNVNFISLAQEFTPSDNVENFKKRLKFLGEIFESLNSLNGLVEDKDLSDHQILADRLEILQIYESAMVAEEKNFAKSENFAKTLGLLRGRIKTLVELTEIFGDKKR